jgi:hypothetical protein
MQNGHIKDPISLASSSMIKIAIFENGHVDKFDDYRLSYVQLYYRLRDKSKQRKHTFHAPE